MVKPLNEINTEFETARGSGDSLSTRVTQERYFESEEPVTPKFTLPHPDPVSFRYELPQPDPQAQRFKMPQPDPQAQRFAMPQADAPAQRFTMPQPDPILPEYGSPRFAPPDQRFAMPQPDPVLPKYDLPRPDQPIPQFTLPQPDPVLPKYEPPRTEQPIRRFTLPQPDPVLPQYEPSRLARPDQRFTLPQPDPPVQRFTQPDQVLPKYELPQPDPPAQRFTMPQPDPPAQRFTLPEPDPSAQRFTLPQPDPVYPKYELPQPDPPVWGYAPPQSDLLYRQPNPAYLPNQPSPPGRGYQPAPENAYPGQPITPQQQAYRDYIDSSVSAQSADMPYPAGQTAAPPRSAARPTEEQMPDADYTGRLRKAVMRSKHDPRAKKNPPSGTNPRQSAKSAGSKKNKKTGGDLEKTDNKRSTKSIIADVLFYSVLIVMVVSVILWVRSSSKPMYIGNFTMLDVLTESMQDTIPKGSLVIVERVDDPTTLKVGDDITFFVNQSTTYTHQIIQIWSDYNNTGKLGFQTKGTNNTRPDDFIVYPEMLAGRVIYHIPNLGMILSFLPGLIMNPQNLIWVSIVFLSVVVFSFSLRGLFSSYKNDKAKQNKPVKKRKGSVVLRKGYNT